MKTERNATGVERWGEATDEPLGFTRLINAGSRVRSPHQHELQSTNSDHYARRVGVLYLFVALLLNSISNAAELASTDEARGREILSRFVETNRYWLLGPPPSIRNYSYTLHRIGGTQSFTVTNPAKTPHSRRQGVTYFSMLHQLAMKPETVTVRSVTAEGSSMRLTLAFDPAVRGACGNGVENSWNGYFNLGGDVGFIVLDSKRLVPLEAGLGKLTERFDEYVAVDASHFVPLAITIQKEEMRFDWRFRLYEPGLWLFDDSSYGGRRVAWVERVEVNEETAELRQAVAESLAREKAELAGAEAAQEFLKANLHWLRPALEQRRGLIYEYRQESPYRERVFFDKAGNIFAELEASKDSPDRPTQQKLWFADGRKVISGYDDVYVKAETAPASPDRTVQHLAMGLALECALTRLAREPDAFWVERLPAKTAAQYLLMLHPRKRAQLFAGTMLSFTSWAYMHDVGFDRSEIVCDAATHQPLQERDYSGKDELKGQFHFEQWLRVRGEVFPGRIRALVSYAKGGKDQSLEMEAIFRNATGDVWLLDRVESNFRGGVGGSTGIVWMVVATAETLAPVARMLAKVELTEQTLTALQTAPEGSVQLNSVTAEWQPAMMKESWTEAAQGSAKSRDDKALAPPVIGIHRARYQVGPGDTARLSLEGISTASWKEFETEWKASWRDASGNELTIVSTNLVIRAESAPAGFVVDLPVPASLRASASSIAFEGTVRRMTAMYHGHRLWMRFKADDGE